MAAFLLSQQSRELKQRSPNTEAENTWYLALSRNVDCWLIIWVFHPLLITDLGQQWQTLGWGFLLLVAWGAACNLPWRTLPLPFFQRP